MTQQPTCNRRAMIAGSIATLSLPMIAKAAPGAELIVGTYAREGGKGLYPLSFDAGTWTAKAPITAVQNASFGVRSTRHGLRYLLNEQDEGALGIYDAGYRARAVRPTLGAAPCHAVLSADHGALAVANYGGGSVTLFPLDPATGLPQGEAQVVKHEGSGPNADRQAGPHAHWVGFSREGDWLHSVDLGADAVFAHRYDKRARRIVDTTIAFRAKAGSGPRHLARHPRLPVSYLVSELSSTLTVLDAGGDGSLRERRVLSTLPKDVRSPSFVAHIAMNAAGTRLYVSNRGHNSIAVFAIAANGNATPIQHVSTGGDWPRFFLLVEGRGIMLVGNERSGEIAVLDLARDGRLRLTEQRVKVPGVVFLGE